MDEGEIMKKVFQVGLLKSFDMVSGEVWNGRLVVEDINDLVAKINDPDLKFSAYFSVAIAQAHEQYRERCREEFVHYGHDIYEEIISIVISEVQNVCDITSTV